MRRLAPRLLRDLARDAAARRVAGNTGWLLAAEIVATLVSLVQFPLVARLLGVERFGVLHLVLSTVGLISALLTVRVWETIICYLSKFMAEDDPERALAIMKVTFGLDLVQGILVFAFLAVIAPLLAALVVHTPDATDLIRLEALRHLFLATSAASTAVLRVFDRFKWLSAFNAASSIVSFVFVALVLVTGLGVAGYIVAFVLVSAVQTVVLYLAGQRLLRIRFPGRWWRADFGVLRPYRREIGVMLFSMNVDAIRKIATGNLDTVVLGLFAGPYQAGLYRLAKQLAGYVNRLTNPLYTSLYPEIARLYNEHGIQRVRTFANRLSRALGLGVVVSIAGVLLLARPLVPLIFGRAYEPALPLIYIVMFMNIWLVFIWAPGLLLTLGNARQLTTINIASSAVMIVALFGLAPLWHGFGAAVALVLNYFVWTVLIAWYLNRLPELRRLGSPARVA